MGAQIEEVKTPLEQLKDFCDCLPKDMKDEDLQRNLDELIHLLSILLCWQQQPCETFLNSARVEYIDVGEYVKCGCEGGIMEFSPFYQPFDPQSMKITLINISGLNIIETVIPSSDFVYAPGFNVFRINIGKYIQDSNCVCVGKYKLKLEYNAGYENIPECLLQFFCDFVHVMYDKNTCKCPKCQACKDFDETVIEYSEFDGLTPKIIQYAYALILSAYKQQIGMLSLCYNYKLDNIYAVVV